jgi:protein SCO1
MSARTSRLVLPLLAFLFGVVALGLTVYVTYQPRVAGQSTVGGPFSLVDQDGKPVTEKDLAGSPSLVFFGFTHCPDVCPTTLQDMTLLYQALGPKADRLKAYFVTVDPERDTPEQMKSYLSAFDPHIRGLTGDRAALDPMLKAYRVYSKKVPTEGGDYTMDHTALVYLMDKDGHFASAFNLQQKPADAAKQLEPMM